MQQTFFRDIFFSLWGIGISRQGTPLQLAPKKRAQPVPSPGLEWAVDKPNLGRQKSEVKWSQKDFAELPLTDTDVGIQVT
jgi:hypothetical protein